MSRGDQKRAWKIELAAFAETAPPLGRAPRSAGMASLVAAVVVVAAGGLLT